MRGGETLTAFDMVKARSNTHGSCRTYLGGGQDAKTLGTKWLIKVGIDSFAHHSRECCNIVASYIVCPYKGVLISQLKQRIPNANPLHRNVQKLRAGNSLPLVPDPADRPCQKQSARPGTGILDAMPKRTFRRKNLGWARGLYTTPHPQPTPNPPPTHPQPTTLKLGPSPRFV